MVCGVDTKDGLPAEDTRCPWSPQLQIAIVWQVEHELRSEPLTRRAVLRLMVAATGPAGAGGAPPPLGRPLPSRGEKIPPVGPRTGGTLQGRAPPTPRPPPQDRPPPLPP